MGRTDLLRESAVLCFRGPVAYRVILKRSKWSRAVRGPTFPLLIETWLLLVFRLPVSFAFPATINLWGLGDPSYALICRRRHDTYAVESGKGLLLTGAKADVDSYLEKWRKTAVIRVCEAFELAKKAEMKKFGEKSSTVRPTVCRLRILTTTPTLLATMRTLMETRDVIRVN
jgi:hypothetical protein